MYAKSNFLQNKLLDFLYRAQAFAIPSTYYIGLMTSTNGNIARSTAYALNNTVSVLTSDGTYHLYKVTTAGTTAATAPTYPGVANEVITDGTAVLTEQTAALESGAAIVEPSGGAYARVAVTPSLTEFSGTQGAGTTAVSSGTSGTISNNASVSFPTSTAAWGNVWGFFIADAATAGNVYHFGDMSAPNAIGSGVTASFSASNLQIEEV